MKPEPRDVDVSADGVDQALEALWRGRSREFERLLDRTGEPGASLDVLFGGAISQGLLRDAVETVPSVGNYTILRELGRGGMGVVYEAQQTNPPRLVALKVIRTGHLPRAQQVRLFQREIHSLARLRHPHIAAIHDAGLTDDGRPFFAMELVQGRTLLEFVRGVSSAETAEAQRIPTILRLFVKICEAINYAHQRGVIHRDLKPSNILVPEEVSRSGSGSVSGGGPEVKVLDFGLARIIDAETPETQLTDAGQIRGTLAYMAPEQFQGSPAEVDTRSDVYALGVLLFEMLTGRLPYDLKQSPMAQAARIVCETVPIRPSALCPALRGDLETILLKTLSKDREQRYQGASGLAEDVARFLADQPILARPHSAMYQLRKLVARHRVASLALLAVVLTSMLGFAVSASLYARTKRAQMAEAVQRRLAEEQRDHALEAEHRAEQHRVEATVAADRATAVTTFVSEMLSSADPSKDGREVKVIEVLDRAAERAGETLSGTPEVEATVRHVLGLTYLNLGLSHKAEPQLRSAVDIRMARLGPTHDDAQISREALAGTLSSLSRHDEAEALLRDVSQTFAVSKGTQDPATLRSMASLGMILYERGKLDEAEPLLRETVDAQKRLLGDDHLDTLVSMSGLGIVLQEKGLLVEAEAAFRHVAEHRRRLFAEDHPRRLVAEENLASVLHDLGQLEEAERLYRGLLGTCRVVFGDEHTRTLVLINNLAKVLQDQQRLEEAEPLFRENYETRRRAFGAEQQGTLVAVNNLASLYKDMERFEDAESLMRETVEIARRILPDDHWYHAAFAYNHGACLMRLGRLEEAESKLLEGEAGFLRAFGPDHARVVRARELLAELKEQRRTTGSAEAPGK